MPRSTLRALDLSGLSDDALLEHARGLEAARWKAAGRWLLGPR
jgi:hypothetical protein